jgi:hypothetical protein
VGDTTGSEITAADSRIRQAAEGRVTHPEVLLLLNIDGDPDPRDAPPDDDLVLRQYQVMARIVADHSDGKAAMGIHTSPMFRRRFFEPPFVEIWHQWQDRDANLALHTEEDFYQLPQHRGSGICGYLDAEGLRPIITESLAKLRNEGLEVEAYRAGSGSQTRTIVDALFERGIRLDLSCAPGIAQVERAIDWRQAPLSAYRMSRGNLCAPARADEADSMIAVPVEFDGDLEAVRGDDSVRKHHLANDTSDLKSLTMVWSTIRARAQDAGRTQIVSMLVHTFSILNTHRRRQLQDFLDHAFDHGGEPVSVPGIEVALAH